MVKSGFVGGFDERSSERLVDLAILMGGLWRSDWQID